jgi:hypothetical protein
MMWWVQLLYYTCNRLWAGLPGFDFQHCKNFLFSTTSRQTLGPMQPPSLWVMGALSLQVEQQRHEADCSPPTGAEVKKDGAIPQPSPYIFMA